MWLPILTLIFLDTTNTRSHLNIIQETTTPRISVIKAVASASVSQSGKTKAMEQNDFISFKPYSTHRYRVEASKSENEETNPSLTTVFLEQEGKYAIISTFQNLNPIP